MNRRRLRFAVGALACFVLPAGSWAEGSGTFAWTMYSHAGEFRVDLVAFDADGRAHLRNPAVLAERACPSVAALLGGSDHWKEGYSGTLLGHLGEVAVFACRELGAASVEVTLHERGGIHGERTTTSQRRCAP